ncbi:MAG TPA: class I SAM-dependent methyltransferase [Allosphingosinicella sp.]|nr:class I SAM-dependent methyltransferase [Allosphingosinicella sp.]
MATTESCAACRGALELVTERRGTAIRRCPACGLVIGESRRPAESDVVATAPGHFTLLREHYGRHRDVTEGLLDKRLAHYSKHLGGPPRHWLEIGPGNGVLADLLEARGCTWLGVEYDEAMAAAMRAEGKPVVRADFSGVDPQSLMDEAVRANGGFDMVSFSQVLEHVLRADLFLANAFAALRPGGLLHVDVPNDSGLTAKLRRANPRSSGYGEVVPPHHMIAYSPAALRSALEGAGFEIVELFGCRYDHPVFGLPHALMNESAKLKLVWALSGLVGGGGNLVALARKRR